MNYFIKKTSCLFLTFLVICVTHGLTFAEVLHSGPIVDKVELTSILNDENQIYFDRCAIENNYLEGVAGVYILDNDDVIPVSFRGKYDIKSKTYLEIGDRWNWEIGDQVEKYYERKFSGNHYKNLEQPLEHISDWAEKKFDVQTISSNYLGSEYINTPKFFINMRWAEGKFPETLKIPKYLGWKTGDKVLLAIGESGYEIERYGWWTYNNWTPVIINLRTREAIALPPIPTIQYDGS